MVPAPVPGGAGAGLPKGLCCVLGHELERTDGQGTGSHLGRGLGQPAESLGCDPHTFPEGREVPSLGIL